MKRIDKFLPPPPRTNKDIQATTLTRTLTASPSLLPRPLTSLRRGLASAMLLEMHQFVPHQLELPEVDVKSRLRPTSEVRWILFPVTVITIAHGFSNALLHNFQLFVTAPLAAPTTDRTLLKRVPALSEV